jgi:23S rRNA (guanine2445-N2)-methyltransferase / 23S rRNA (guanine2069-N7)-methyltransferase
MTTQLNLFATAPKGLELLLVAELKALGATDPAEKLAGVTFTGDLALAYRACLWSRLANRILLSLARFPAATPEELYVGVQSIDWHQHIDPRATLAVHFVTSQSQITHTLYGAQKVKDAVVDQLRDKYGVRPNVAKQEPDVSIYVYLYRDQATVYLDLSGESLHKRGYRFASGSAPLKENLAAAILQRASWFELAQQGKALQDPMCGSGTLLIEAAMLAGDIAPGLNREYYGFLGWKQHDPALWRSLLTEAEQRAQAGSEHIPPLVGYDRDPLAIKIAIENIERANLRGFIHVEKRDVADFVPKPGIEPGLVVVNPPYGERLGDEDELKSLYATLGQRLKEHFVSWRAAVFTGNPDLGKFMGLRSKRSYALFNGAIPCKLLLFDVETTWFIDNSPEAENQRRIKAAQRALTQADHAEVQMFINRVQKNLRKLKKLTNQAPNDSCRVYDADIPEYQFAIDLYDHKADLLEYPAPRFVQTQRVLAHRQQVLAVIADLLNLPPAAIYYKAL